MKEYIKDLEESNEKLQNELSTALTEYHNFKELVNKKLCFRISLTLGINQRLVEIEMFHHLFNDPIHAVKRLKHEWNKNFKLILDSYKKDGFEFKYFTICSYHVIVDEKMATGKIPPVVSESWSFETKKEVHDTLKYLMNRK